MLLGLATFTHMHTPEHGTCTKRSNPSSLCGTCVNITAVTQFFSPHQILLDNNAFSTLSLSLCRSACLQPCTCSIGVHLSWVCRYGTVMEHKAITLCREGGSHHLQFVGQESGLTPSQWLRHCLAKTPAAVAFCPLDTFICPRIRMISLGMC